MRDLSRVVNALKRFCRYEKKITIKLVEEYVFILQGEASENGLSENLLDLCSELIVKKCQSSGMMEMLVKCLIPERIVPDPVATRVLTWILAYKNRGYKSAVVRALQWVAGILEYGLIDEKPVSQFYYMFLTLLECPHTEYIACWLVVRLTKPDDIDRNLVLKILHMKFKNSQTRDLILWCFKSFKPECVPEPVKTYSIRSSLNVSSFLKNAFEKAQQRRPAETRNAQIKHVMGDSSWNVPERRKRGYVEIIPPVQYIYFGSQLYRQKEISVLQIRNWKQLSANAMFVGIPCNVLSLFQNPLGLHILACGNEHLHNRLSFTLHLTLTNVIVDRFVEVPLKDQEHLLNQICALQEYIQQGIPVVSRFVATYLMFWDGITFLPQIMQLLPWIVFSSVSDLKMGFLVPLYDVYITSNVKVKSSILRALTKLVHNVILKIYDIRNTLYSHSLQFDDGEIVLKTLIEFVDTLCVLGLNFELESVTLLSEVLRFYELLVDMEEKYRLHVRSIMPPTAVCFALFSRNFMNLERVCSLLIKYKTSVRNAISLQMEIPRRAGLISRYSNDFVNVLWCQCAFSMRRKGYIFKDLSNLSNWEIKEEAFKITRSIPFITFRRRNVSETDKRFIKFLRLHFPNIYKFLLINLQKRRRKYSK